VHRGAQHPGARDRGVPLPAGRTEELDECHLDLRVSVDALTPTSPERSLEVVDGLRRDRQEAIISDRPLPCDRCLRQVTDAVELVPPGEVGVRLSTGELDERAQVAVRSLCGRDDLDHRFRRVRERRVPGAPEFPTRRLQPLVDVGVEEREGDAGVVDPTDVAALASRSMAQVVERAGGLESRETVWDGALAVRRQSFAPEPSGHP
jgi:hypothetical protein